MSNKKSNKINEVKCDKCGYVGVPVDKAFGTKLCQRCNIILSSTIGIDKVGR